LFSGLFSLPLSSADTAAEAVRTSPAQATHSFIAGSENALVRRLNSAVTSPQLPFNPIVLYGSAGTGKSSVARALAALRRDEFRLDDVIVTTAVDLARALAHAIDSQAVADLRSHYLRCDLLVVDDVQQLAGKSPVQQFLVTTLDALVRRGSLVIATSRLAPAMTVGLSQQLVSRLTGGLVVELSLPGPLARRELVADAASHVGLRLKDEAISELAHAGVGDGAPYLTAAALRHSVLELAAQAEFGECSQKKTTVQAESSRQKAVCRQAAALAAKHFGFTLSELKGKSRRQALADARGLAMFLSRRLSGASYAEIGRQFGNRDHTTVLHACQKFESIVQTDESMRRLIDDFAAQIVSQGAN
jgi:chromosomal replication initiator protein